MKNVKGLIEKKLSKWKGKEWYHQRFDGAPYYLYFIGEAHVGTLAERKMGGDFSAHFCFFEDGKADWYFEMEDIKKVYTSILQAAKKRKNISAYFIKLWKKEEDLFNSKCLEIGKTDLKKLSDTELVALHKEFSHITLERFSSSSLIDGFALGTDQLTADLIKKIYDKSKLKDKIRLTEVFSALTAPVHSSFINEAELAMMKMALQMRKDKKMADKLAAEYQKKFFWIRNNFVDFFVLSADYFKKEASKLLTSKVDLAREIKRIEKMPELNRRHKQELLKSLSIKGELKTLLKISEDFTYWQDERKKSTFFMAHYFGLLLQEFCRRTNLALDDIKYLTPGEVSNIFTKRPSAKEIKTRKKGSVLYWDKSGYEIVSGNKVAAVKKVIAGDGKKDKIDDFRGLSASVGRASGTVKILKSAKEIDKINKGDVLVAVMTRPDYVQAMKKAVAIVTDEGGVTCHAAIISRELGIPCIIGTKIATKVLHDGDQVEVNANHGWVRIIKRA